MYLIYANWNETYLLLLFGNVCNEVHEHMQWLNELW